MFRFCYLIERKTIFKSGRLNFTKSIKNEINNKEYNILLIKKKLVIGINNKHQ